MRIVFCGTPQFAVPTLKYLLAQTDFEIVGVITQPDRPRGRGQEVSFSPVKEAALGANIPVYQPERIRAAESEELLRKLAPDCMVIIAYGQIIPARFLPIPKLGWINLHASLLPKYRGAAPINWAIVNGETRTGLTTMRIDAGMDTGEMLLRREIEIGPKETALELTVRLAELGGPLMAEYFAWIGCGNGCFECTEPRGGQLRSDAEKRGWAHRLEPACRGDLQPHARICAVAGRLHCLSGGELPGVGRTGV